jgi:hypothetical protein
VDVGAGILTVDGLFITAYVAWMRARLDYLASPLQFLTNACVILFLVQSVDRLMLCLGYFWIRLKGVRPVPPLPADKDIEADPEGVPMVLVQMPIEREIGSNLFPK